MIDVCLIYDIDNITRNILLQTPNASGVFNSCKFHLYNQNNIKDLPKETDALIVLNSPISDINIKCNPNLTFLVSQEATSERYRWHTNSFKYFRKVYTQWPIKKKNIIPSHGYLTWYIDKNFDQLRNISLNKPKNKGVAYIGNKEAILPGQVKRNNFVEALNQDFMSDAISVDLIGRTYNNPIENKFNTLYNYQYGLAIENTLVNHYWTEKLSDLFLAGCLPFYIGPKNIFEYFPKESMIILDYENIENSKKIIRNAIDNNEYDKRKEYIEIARNKILNEYNLFYGLSKVIETQTSLNNQKRKEINIPANYWSKKQTFIQKIKNKLS